MQAAWICPACHDGDSAQARQAPGGGSGVARRWRCAVCTAPRHPRIIVYAEDFDGLRARAERDGVWRAHRQRLADSGPCLTYLRAAPSSPLSYRDYTQRLTSMTKLARRASLGFLLLGDSPEARRAWSTHVATQLRHWVDINAMREQRPAADWASTVVGGSAFFVSVIALDLIRGELGSHALRELEALLRRWFDFERQRAGGTWYLAKYGAMGCWARREPPQGAWRGGKVGAVGSVAPLRSQRPHAVRARGSPPRNEWPG